jgi:hypothetical protein
MDCEGNNSAPQTAIESSDINVSTDRRELSDRQDRPSAERIRANIAAACANVICLSTKAADRNHAHGLTSEITHILQGALRPGAPISACLIIVTIRDLDRKHRHRDTASAIATEIRNIMDALRAEFLETHPECEQQLVSKRVSILLTQQNRFTFQTIILPHPDDHYPIEVNGAEWSVKRSAARKDFIREARKQTYRCLQSFETQGLRQSWYGIDAFLTSIWQTLVSPCTSRVILNPQNSAHQKPYIIDNPFVMARRYFIKENCDKLSEEVQAHTQASVEISTERKRQAAGLPKHVWVAPPEREACLLGLKRDINGTNLVRLFHGS